MTRPPLHVNLNPVTRPTPTSTGSGQLSLLSTAIALALGLVSMDASALALGRLNVQSALGEPLRAEIDVTEISAAEADSMKLNIASPEAFQAAGVAYNSALADVRMQLQRRADGRYVVRLAGNRSLNDPFIDLLLEANWGGGRVVRDYTVLLDPPRSRQAAVPINPVGPQMQIGNAPPTRMAQSPAAPPVAQVAPPPRPRPVPAPSPAPMPAAERSVRTGTGDGQQVAVRPGDTASKIAGAYKPAEVSLDQMLVAMLRTSPDAFLGGNVNRMKSGAVINVPTAAQATATPPDEARRTVTAQSRDFADYRQRLAGNAPTSRVARADRQAGGKLQTNVQDRNAGAASPDKLTVSPGGPTAAADEKLAAERQAKDTSARVAELSKNISELNKLQSATAPAATAPGAPAAAPATPAAAPAATAPAAAPAAPAAATPAAPATPGVTVPVAAAPATPPTAETTPPAPPVAATPAPAPAAKLPAVTPVKTPTPAERGFFAELMDNPLMLGAAALIALLIGFLLYRVLGRKRQDAGDSVFLESRIPKDSFFGASGGESVDTRNRGAASSSLSYSPSQLDAGDVDPVAEADVYLAYGRDLQAEEILREALRITPERTAIHLKLLEIHAKRRDLRAYEAMAADVHKLTGGTGTEWNRVVEMGRELDPGNPLYQPGVRSLAAGAGAATLADGPVTIPMEPTATPTVREPAREPIASPPAFVASVAPLDFDLDLSKPPVAAKVPVQPVPVPVPVAVAMPTPPSASLPQARPSIPDIDDYERTVRAPLDDGHDHTEFANDFDTAPAALEPMRRAPAHDEERTQPATLRAGLPGDSGFIEFDMSSMTGRAPLETSRGSLEGHDDPHESPHAIKLSLARELQAIGDAEGARSLVEEVAAEATGDLKAEARQLLTQLA
ncbi:FimV/HubP family polar landmark protein [Variovorax robiniae]|uniref:FimV/HubP family polar landmark protein n=1 Tax=Variovorax robiniae TaxID=1836199 RepID=A0ABU8X311_9BURK